MLARSRLGAPMDLSLVNHCCTGQAPFAMMFYHTHIYIYIYIYIYRSTYAAFVMQVHGSRGDEDASAAVPASLLHSRSSAPSAHFSG